MSLLKVEDLFVQFKVRKQEGLFGKSYPLNAVNKISFELEEGRTLGVVGESGCGKSSLIRAICGLVTPTSGHVEFDGQTIDYSSAQSLRDMRAQVQMIFQDPLASLNPRMTIGKIVEEPLGQFFPQLDKAARQKRVIEMFDRVGILPSHINRYPHEFSGGQCQRIGIARALICQPKLLVCDEPVSALDVSIQAQVVNLLKELQNEMGLTIIFVAHDLGIVRHISDEIMVMYLGSMMEYGKAHDVIDAPMHPYTQSLLSAIPVPDPSVKVTPQLLEGDLPSPIDLPAGCPFQTRCPSKNANCELTQSNVQNLSGRKINCNLKLD